MATTTALTTTDRMKVVRNALLTISGAKVWHFTAPAKHGDEYIVWQEESADDLVADGKHTERCLVGSIDLFTKTEYSARIDEIERALEQSRISYRLVSTQYEDETGFIHYEWEWSY